MLRASFFCGVFCAVFAACSHDVSGGDVVSVVDGSDDAAVTWREPGEVDSQRLWYGVENRAVLSADVPLVYGHFDMLPKGKVDVTVRRVDDDPDTGVGIKLYRVNPTGTLRLLGELDGEHARGTVRVDSRAGGTFVVEATSSLGEFGVTGLVIDVVCKRRDGNCARLRQPGDFCGGRGGNVCDDGLFCRIDDNCGRADAGGVCTIPTQVCPRTACRPVCGCDGVDYCDACHAHAVGANVDHEGSCAVVDEDVCDPAVYARSDEQQAVDGVWTWQGDSDTHHVNAVLEIDGDTFLYEQTWLRICPTGNTCRFVTEVKSMIGSAANLGFAVQLTPDGDAPPELAQAFSVDVNCEGDVQLSTTELGFERTFARDRCAAVSCGEGERCVMEEVMCIRAPCPPQPRCIAD